MLYDFKNAKHKNKYPESYYKDRVLALGTVKSTGCTSMKCGFQTTDGAPEQFVL